ncbi:MAG: PEP-CTERM sorting domain-containing protein [Opitutales bacterium]|nr:PEP-CTERM sorting domain-containing protein [Opitutales bacterium]
MNKSTLSSLAALLATAVAAHGQIVWTGETGTGADPDSGNWSDAGNWDPSAPTSGPTTALSFSNTDPANPEYTSTLDIGGENNVFDVNQMTFNNNATSGNDVGIFIERTDNRSLRFTGANPSLIQNGSRRSEIRVPILFDPTSGDSIISGNGDGFLVVGAGGSVDAGTHGTLTKNGSSTFFFNVSSGGFSADRIIVNDGRFGFDGRLGQHSGVIVEVYGSGSYGLLGHGGDGFTIGGAIGDGWLRNQTNQDRAMGINVEEGGNYEFNGTITDSRIRNVRIGGEGTQIFGNGAEVSRDVLVGSTSQTSEVSLSGGNLAISGTVTGGGTTYVGDGGTLSGDGTWERALVVEDGGTLSPGASTGTLTVGNTTLLNGFIYNWEFNSFDDTSDLINVLGSLDLTDGQAGTINMIGLGGSDFSEFGGSLAIFTTNGIVGADDGDTLDWIVTLNGVEQSWTATVVGDTVVIPEPSTYAALFGIGALGMVLFLRRRARR